MNNRISFNNEYSFFQFKNITHLYLICDITIDENKAIDFINNFSNLERLIIKTNNIQLVKDITIKFPTLKLELFSDEVYQDAVDFSLLDTISEESIDFASVTADITVDGDILEDKDKFVQHYNRFNSLSLKFDFGPENEDQIHPILSDIFSNKFLQYITILNVCVHLKDLIKVVKDNNHIISFRASIPIYFLGYRDKNNKLEYWIEFCEHLATNATLKGLHLSYGGFRSTQYPTHEVKRAMSDALYSALESNQTLEYLTIPYGILTESFYRGIYDINQIIKDIHYIY